MAAAPGGSPGDSAFGLFAKAASSSGREASSGCPVSAEERDAWLAKQKPQQTQQHEEASASGCPVGGASPTAEETRHAARINMPVVPNAALGGQQSSGGAALSTARAVSSIPIADPSSVPAHQQGMPSSERSGQAVWVYPSEQQFYNAMARKGWQPSEGDMTAVVAIHNAVNERAWQHVLAWEALHACDCPHPKLLRFKGRPTDYSPKARLLNFLGYKLPFDRHDWVVDRCGTEVRYVIDFYSGVPQQGTQASMHLDVRPAIDSFGAAIDRLRMQWRWVSSGRWREE